VLDAIDVKILNLLQKQGRMKRNDLAERVGLSLPSVSERLRKLEESGCILGYHALVDHVRCGRPLTAFIEVTVDSSKHYGAFLTHAKGQEDILECHAVTGEASHLLKIRTSDTQSLEKLLGRIQAWGGVANTRTHLVLSSTKETSTIKVDELS